MVCFISKFIFIFLFKVTISQYKEQKRITLPIKLNDFDVPCISFELGNPPQKFYFYASTVISKMFIYHRGKSDKGFDPKLSNSKIEDSSLITLKEVGSDTKGKHYKDTLGFVDDIQIYYTIKNFSFELITEGKCNGHYNGVIGLGYLYKKNEEKFAFIQRLKDDGYIDNEIFYIKKKKDGIFLNIGNFDVKKINSFKYKKCQLIPETVEGEKNSLWQCNLNVILFEDKVYEVNTRLTFSVTANVICTSMDFYEFFKEEYFGLGIKEGVCRERNEEDFITVYCNDDYYINPNLYIGFVLGKWNIKVKIIDLMSIYNKEQFLRLFHCQKSNYEWGIGYKFLNKYTLVFDKENSIIGLEN